MIFNKNRVLFENKLIGLWKALKSLRLPNETSS